MITTSLLYLPTYLCGYIKFYCLNAYLHTMSAGTAIPEAPVGWGLRVTAPRAGDL